MYMSILYIYGKLLEMYKSEAIILSCGCKWYRSNSAFCFVEVYPFVTISQGLFYCVSSRSQKYLNKVLNEFTIS